MGWFGRKRSEAPQPDDRIQWVTSTARRLLAEKGVESTVEFGERLEDAQLVAADGRRFPIYNLVPKTEGASREAAERLIDQHLDLVLGTATDPDPSTFDPEDLRARVRTRILPVVDDLRQARVGRRGGAQGRRPRGHRPGRRRTTGARVRAGRPHRLRPGDRRARRRRRSARRRGCARAPRRDPRAGHPQRHRHVPQQHRGDLQRVLGGDATRHPPHRLRLQ